MHVLSATYTPSMHANCKQSNYENFSQLHGAQLKTCCHKSPKNSSCVTSNSVTLPSYYYSAVNQLENSSSFWNNVTIVCIYEPRWPLCFAHAAVCICSLVRAWFSVCMCPCVCLCLCLCLWIVRIKKIL